MNGANRQLDFDPLAYDDIDQAEDFYQKHSEQACERFLLFLDQTLEKICQDPQIGRRLSFGLMICPIKRYPYRIFYHDLEKRGVVYILGVVHDARHPDFVEDRMKNIPPDAPDDPDEDDA